MYTTFNKKKYDHLKQPMFFGESVNVARYDQQKYNVFEKLIEKQLSFFWRPEEVDISKDRKDFESLSEAEQHIFLSNLKYQTLLDSVQGRSPNIAFLPIVSLPELETWIEVWSFSETIHSRSYTHIIRNIINDPSVVFDSIIDDVNILERADSVTKYYDDLINKVKTNAPEKEIKKALLLCMIAVNVLEGIRFYVSFACSFAFAERAKMEGNAKIIKLIARDEALHLTGTQHIINILQKEDAYMKYLIDVECVEVVKSIFVECAEQEKRWCDYLFSKGSMIGLNADILKEYVEYITDLRAQSINVQSVYNKKSNPLPWINSWLVSDNVQVAPQETEITSYLVGSIDSSLGDNDFDEFDL